MDADSLRLILLGLGILLVLGIYLWDRWGRRHAAPRSHARPQPEARRAPRFEESDEEEPPPAQPDTGEEAVQGSGRKAPDALQPGAWDQIELDAEPVLDDATAFDVHGSSDYLHSAPELQDDLPRLIVLINVVARDGLIEGPALAKAAKEVDLKPGPMDIFHRYDSQLRDQVLFSMASMVEPGSFPMRALQDYTTAGVTLFTQLPGVRDGLAVYADMLFTAERLAALLDADLHDETHSVLTKQWIEHTRERILEHRHKVQLARSRP